MKKLKKILVKIVVFGILLNGCSLVQNPTIPANNKTTSLAVVWITSIGRLSSQIYTPSLKDVDFGNFDFRSSDEDIAITKILIEGFNNVISTKIVGLELPSNPVSTVDSNGNAIFLFASQRDRPVMLAHSNRVVSIEGDTTPLGSLIPGSEGGIKSITIEGVGLQTAKEFKSTLSFSTPTLMKFEEVEPRIGFDISDGYVIPSSPKTKEDVLPLVVYANGQRDLNFNQLVVVKKGSNNPERNVTHFSLWNDFEKIAETVSTGSTVLFDENSIVPLPVQTITHGSAVRYRVKADTTLVRAGVVSGDVTFRLEIPKDGLTWTYSKFNNDGIANVSSGADFYPVIGPTRVY